MHQLLKPNRFWIVILRLTQNPVVYARGGRTSKPQEYTRTFGRMRPIAGLNDTNQAIAARARNIAVNALPRGSCRYY